MLHVLGVLLVLIGSPHRGAAIQSTPTAGQPNSRVEHAPHERPAIGRDTVGVAFGDLTLSGLLQVWYIGGMMDPGRTFRIRRTELKLTGQFRKRMLWTVMIDPAKLLGLLADTVTFEDSVFIERPVINQATRVLQDAFLTLQVAKPVALDIGQRKVPLSLEGLQSSATLKTVERALFLSDRARGGDLGDVRDIGVMAHGSISKRFEYMAGIFNGLGENQNTVDFDDAVAPAARIIVRPGFLEGLQLGASGGWDPIDDDLVELPPRPFFPRYRLGADVLYDRGRFTLQSEVMSGRDLHRDRLGAYGLVAYRITSKFEVVAQFDTWNPDTSDDDNPATTSERDWLVGLNYYAQRNNLKFQANLIQKTFSNDAISDRLVLLINAQASW